MIAGRSVFLVRICPIFLGVGLAAAPRLAVGTPLDDYVAAPDPSYTYSVVDTITGNGYIGHVLDMTSQTWRTPAEVDRTEWQHWLTVVNPNGTNRTTALLIIEGGDNDDPAPTSTQGVEYVAILSNTVVAYLQMVPNQRLKFADEADPRYIENGRKEDELIAYTWDKFLRTGDPTWPAQLPMTKAAVRAMDAVQTFCATPEGGEIAIDDFVVIGGSKRGWTAWLTAAVDPRVRAVMPAVIDILNVKPSMLNHYASYGFWAPAISDYEDIGIMNWINTPQFDAMLDIVDPYVYRDRYTMPKFIVNGAGDQFFHPDSSRFYWDDLPGEKHLRYVPNGDHGLAGGVDAAINGLFYYLDILFDNPRQQFSWTMEPNGSIRVEAVDLPELVTLWQATNPNARDFRLEEIGKAWTGSTLTDQGDGVYVGQVPVPPTGYTAFFVELTYPTTFVLFKYRYTTQVRIVPDPVTLNTEVVNAPWGRVVEVDPNFPRYYEPNSVAALTAESVSGKQFRHWEIYDPNHPGDANCAVVDANNPIAVPMDTDREVTAVFACGGTGLLLPLLGAGLVVCCLVARRVRRSV